MRVLITGGAGFVGSHLCENFLRRGAAVTVLDIGSSHKVEHLLSHPEFRLVEGSVLDRDQVDSLVQEADLVYHLAAIVGVDKCVRDPFTMLQVNVNGTQIVLAAAHEHKKRLVFSSTSEIYGRNPKFPWREDDDRLLGSTAVDRWGYATAKSLGEHFCFAYHHKGLKVAIIRYFNVYGPRLDELEAGRLLSIFMGQLLHGADLTVIGDGSQKRCFTYVTDAVEATVQAGLRPEAVGRAFNIGADTETSVLEFAQLMLELYGPCASKIKFIEPKEAYGEGYEDIPRRVPDNTRMRTLLGVTPQVPLREGLRQTMEWFKHEQSR